MSTEAVTNVILMRFKAVTPENAMDVLKQVCQYAPSYDDALVIIEQIAKGTDGIAGTSDDIISQEIVETLKVLVKQDLVGNLIRDLYQVDKVLCKCCH